MFKPILSVLLIAISPLSWSVDKNDTNPITVFIAKKIITMDPAWPTATAVAVKDGKILSVGSLDDLKPWLTTYPYKLDKTFEQKILLPGFIEPHGHPLIGGTAMSRPLLTYLPTPNPYGPPFPGVKTKAQAMDRLKKYVADHKDPNKPLLVWGYDIIAMGSSLDANELDKVSPTLPLIVWDASEHIAFANTAALNAFHITSNDRQIDGLKLTKKGQPNGQFYGVTAATFILKKVFAATTTPEDAYKNVKFLMDLSHRNGITTTTELTFGIIDFQLEHALYNKYFNNPKTPMRLVAITDAVSASRDKKDQAVDFVKSLQKESTDKLMFKGVKFFSDDAFVSLNMVVENPGYIDGHQGQYITPPNQLAAVISPWWDAGFNIHVHSNGNGGNASTIRALAELMQRKPRFDHRFSVEHYGISTPAMAKTLKQLGGVVSVNPSYLYARAEINEAKIGTERADTAAAFHTLVSAGVPTSLHSDTPVSSPEPLKEVWMVVNRFGLSGKVHGPAERVSLNQALRMITIDAAYTLGVDDKIGSITPGKWADFAVLDNDPYTTPPTDLKDIPVWGTVVSGKIYAANDYRY
ncbi:amidohydrolase [Legionella gresilensis]|uniref:amidohydrolase n=1 Tax=Legionella gresilensis TaxID=91823 RepID=UPI001A94ED7F|nr:amidohydrolase [Legionella gresilensis]